MSEIQSGSRFSVICCDGSEGMKQLEPNSVKLVYGSPPYPNAVRDYGVWTSDEYIDKIAPFIDGAIYCLREDGFLIINVKANRERQTVKIASRRSLVVERLAIQLEEKWHLYCVDIEIWVKENPVPTGLRVACQDAYEQNLWFSIAPKWRINMDSIRRPYEEHSRMVYNDYEYKPRSNGLTYVRKAKRIECNPHGALPINVIKGGVSASKTGHQASQPLYLPQKYILATTVENDLVVDPWAGSGTTGEAALLSGRRFIGFDIKNEYVDLARTRLGKYQAR